MVAALALTLLTALLSGPVAGQGAPGNGTLLVAGTTLAISPESQTVPFGALEGDVLTIRDLTAKIHLRSGFSKARTEPPPTMGASPMRGPQPEQEPSDCKSPRAAPFAHRNHGI